jgi:hypothetical protein
MNKKYLYIIGSVVLLSMLGGGVASAFSISNVDGVWGNIDGVTSQPGTYAIDIIGYARNNVRAPLANNQGYYLNANVCSGQQLINPQWPDPSRWTSQSNWGGFGSHTSTCTNAPDLFFSQYVFGERTSILSCSSTSTSSDRCHALAFEIVNRTGASVNLSNYEVWLSTGNTSFTKVSLSGNLANNGVHVIANYRATGSSYNVSYDTRINNNNDQRTILLMKKGVGDTEGARCDRWATGPGNNPIVYSDWDPAIQTPPNTDENQVRYGRNAFQVGNNWRQYACEITDFATQSGFGFDGVNGVIDPPAMTPFFLGTFTHYNNQIYSTDNSGNNSNDFQYVDLTITVPVKCPDGSTPIPASFQIVPKFILDETSNTAGTCIYGEPGDVPCPDKVTIEFPETNPTFVCAEGTYTVNILGFTSEGLGNQKCWESYDENSVSAAFITQEDQDNHACLWARIEQPLADISVAKSCWAFDTFSPYYLVTTSNLGPGASRGVTMTDTLPSGVTFKSYTSQLITTSGTIDQGTCSVAGQTVTCSLNTPLQDYSTDPLAKWVVRINVEFAEGDEITNTAVVSALTADPKLSNNTATATCNPSSVSIISFDGEKEEDGVLLTWETANESDNLGFNLYRAEGPELPRQKINPSLIPSKNPGSTAGSTYEYLDSDLASGEYFYWLEDLDFTFSRTLYGPISVRVK